MQVMLEVNCILQYLNHYAHIYLIMLHRQHLINMQLRLSAEFISDHWLQVPLLGEDGLVAVLEVFKRSAKPGEAALGVVEGGIGLA